MSAALIKQLIGSQIVLTRICQSQRQTLIMHVMVRFCQFVIIFRANMTVVIIILTYVSVSGMLSKTCRTFRKYHVQSDLWFLLSPFYTVATKQTRRLGTSHGSADRALRRKAV